MSEEREASPPRVYEPDLAEHGDSSEEGPKEILLRKEEREHARSRRLRDGDEVVVLDGKGLRVRATLSRNGTAVLIHTFPSSPFKESFSFSSSSLSSSPLPGEPSNRVTVLLACAEPARVEWAIEKGTECGAAGFVLLACERSQKSHVAALSSPARLARLQRIAVEATKQCDRTIVPLVDGPKRIEELLRKGRGERSLFVADPSGSSLEDGPRVLRRTRLPSERSEFKREEAGASASRRAVSGPGLLLGETLLAIGPEGGFSPSEIFLFKANSSFFFSLGPRILRLETAVVVALARLVEAHQTPGSPALPFG